ncbi:MAG TPA: hypothetical protein DDZ80_32875 [Cyanobacteria bacterium UBA8803]|nr:hypothetical protein [Cyanobacteria bacterium UBA9273]HBL62991.1 hypothetical protein [Cyanobacteria bacterium UBA8803]
MEKISLSKTRILTNHQFILLAILLLAVLLRLPLLATHPGGFSFDEAASGYAAYSIFLTKRDEYGKFLPLFLESVGDYRESIYSFLAIPFIKVFGLNEFSTRLPAALSGIFNVFILYCLVKELFNKNIALMAALFLAVSPWHIILSRLAFNANLLPLFFCLGLILFIKSLKKPNLLILSSLTFGLSTWTYFPSRGFVPVFMIGLIFIFRNHLWKNRGKTIISSATFLLIFIPLAVFWFSPEGMARASSVGLVTSLQQLLYHYLTYLSPKFLFIDGKRELADIPLVGQLYIFEIITVTAGIFFILKGNQKEELTNKRKAQSLLLLWLLVYPFPAAFASQATDTRGVIGLPLFAILSAYGICKLYELFSDRKKIYFRFVSAVILTTSVLVFSSYFFGKHFNFETKKGYGIKDAIIYADKSYYSCVVVKNKLFRNMRYFIAFYLKYPPDKYQVNPIDKSIKEYNIGKFRVISGDRNKLDEECLYFIRPYETSQITEKGYDWTEVHSVKHPSAGEVIKLVEVRKTVAE